MSGLFQDLLYPDNPYRAERQAQLALDCRFFVSSLRIVYAELGKASQGLKDLHNDAQSYVGWCLVGNTQQCFEAPAYLTERIQDLEAHVRLALAFEVGRQQEAGLAGLDLFEKTPNKPWFDIRDYFGLIPAAFDGASVREELRKQIGRLRRDRLRLACAWRTLRRATDDLLNTKSFASIQLRTIASLGPSPAQVTSEQVIRSYIDSLELQTMEQASRQTLDWLQVLDERRSAWTHEDNYA
ncbi:hypothetical protein [Pseudomonas sp. NPDC089406]|uniref:hypothetical protein n=1 Tax=Pseudomonas sp. NPDC089406 TaxID=3364463 RepID=UPI00384C621B